MKKLLVVVIALAIGAKMGLTYLFSEDFQKYADKTKAPWTCQVTLVLGEFETLMSHYHEAGQYYSRIPPRCPETEICEKAEFEYAQSLESSGNRQSAIAAYEAFAEKYPNTPRGHLATKAAGILKSA
jgi:outer membrane protein assembly factor BamD (BamD/ComL family)